MSDQKSNPRQEAVWYDSPLFDKHRNAAAHPERPRRLAAVREGLVKSGVASRLERVEPSPVDLALLERLHAPSYIASIQSLCQSGGGLVAMDSGVVPDSWAAALTAAGACQDAVVGIHEGRFRRAFCSVRPPGHHATVNNAMGYCLFCNAAVAAEAALALGTFERVAILDWDVHHGNGTQDMFYHRDDVLYASIHEYPAFPGTGARDEVGTGAGVGFTVNCPLAKSADDADFLHAWQETIRPAFESFGPDLIIISAGFDADQRDPIGQLDITASGFRDLSERLVRWSDAYCNGRIVSLLEGGYAYKALEEDVALHVETLV